VHLHIIYHIIYVKYFVAMVFDWHTTLVPVAYGALYMYNLLVIRTARLESVGNDVATPYRYVILSQTRH